MHKYAAVFLVVLAGAVGCNKSDGESDGGSQASGAQQTGPVLVEAKDGAAVSIGAPPPVSAPSTPPGSAPISPAGPGSKDEYNGEVVTRDDNGTRLDGEALLKRAMMQHVEGKGHPYPTRIEELVELGTLKTLPPAPNGQKWAIDANTKQIVLQ